MNIYNRILLAIDLGEHSGEIAGRAAYLAKALKADVCLLHVLENVPEDYPADVVPPESMDKLELARERAHDRMAEIVRQVGLTDFDILVEAGSTKDEILRVAGKQRADLIMIGAHERHGLALLRGYVIERVLHGARCDVIAVHLPS